MIFKPLAMVNYKRNHGHRVIRETVWLSEGNTLIEKETRLSVDKKLTYMKIV